MKINSRYGLVSVEVPALISVETWDRLQKKLLYNRAMSKKNAKQDYLLRGLIRCVNCGYSFVRRQDGVFTQQAARLHVLLVRGGPEE
jgi:hypothetical protein